MLSRDVCAAPSLTASLTTASGLVPPCHQLPRYMLFCNAGGDCLFSSFGNDVRLGPLILTRTVPADVHQIRLAVTARLQQHLEKDEKVSLMAAAFFYLSQIEKTKASGVLLEAYAGLVTVAESLEAEARPAARSAPSRPRRRASRSSRRRPTRAGRRAPRETSAPRATPSRTTRSTFCRCRPTCRT